MGILVFLSLAGMGVAMDSKPLRRNWNKSGLRIGYFAVLAVGTLFLLFLTIGYLGSSNAAMKAKNLIGVSQSYEEIKAPLVEALKDRPFHPESALYLSSMDQQVFNQTKDEQYLVEAYSVVSRALEDEPYNKELLKQLVGYYDLKGQSDLSYTVYRDNADKFNWDIEWYDALISRSFVLASAANDQKDDAKKQEYSAAGLQAYKHVVDGVEHLKTLPPEQLQGRPFSVTPSIALNAGKLQLMSGDNEAAAATLKIGLSEDYADATNREIARWYLAALKRSGGQDQAVYDLLIAADAAEAAQIDAIVAQQF
ncbi:hypothetical protein D3C75_693510 [compost metagenome]